MELSNREQYILDNSPSPSVYLEGQDVRWRIRIYILLEMQRRRQQ